MDGLGYHAPAASHAARQFAAMFYGMRDDLGREALAAVVVAGIAAALELGFVSPEGMAEELRALANEIEFGKPAGHA